LSAVLDKTTELSRLLVARLEGTIDDPKENLRHDIGVLGPEIARVGHGDLIGAAQRVNLLAEAVKDLGDNVENVHVAVKLTAREKEKKKN
jgi:hypothetical protein